MKVPRRFTLGILMLLITAVAILFAFAGWRKRNLISEVGKLNQEGMKRVSVSDDWFWPVPISDGIVSFDKDEDGRYFADGKLLTTGELRNRYADFSSRLEAIGVSPVSLGLLVTKEMNGGTIYFSMVFGSIEEFDEAMKEMAEQAAP